MVECVCHVCSHNLLISIGVKLELIHKRTVMIIVIIIIIIIIDTFKECHKCQQKAIKALKTTLALECRILPCFSLGIFERS